MPEMELTWSSSEDVVSTRSGALRNPLPSMLTKSVTEYLIQQTGIVTSRAMQTATLVLKKPFMLKAGPISCPTTKPLILRTTSYCEHDCERCVRTEFEFSPLSGEASCSRRARARCWRTCCVLSPASCSSPATTHQCITSRTCQSMFPLRQ